MATELEIQIMNRKVEDPTALFQYPRSSPDAVLKFVTDIFSSQDTSEFFYTSDMKILIEIVLRQLTDLSPGTGMRTEYISLLHQILLNSNYSEHKHQASELLTCLTRIRKEEEKEGEQDRLIAQEILKHASKYF
ncbi:NCK-interacting protein with SH3 domain-like isoform X2 [Stylophora pistillata]|nr:NCK-interacting protein with SH3 domain-like isoform X2 [Stylophora pistillata]